MEMNQVEQSIREIRNEASRNIKLEVRKAVIKAAFGFLIVVVLVVGAFLGCVAIGSPVLFLYSLCFDHPKILFWYGAIALSIFIGYLITNRLWRKK